VQPTTTALVHGTAAGESFETHHNCLGGGHFPPTVAHNLDIVHLQWWLVANCCVSRSMENGDHTAEHLGIGAVKEGNHTHAAVDIDCRVAQIDTLCWWQVMSHYSVILDRRHGAVACQIGHHLEAYLLSSVEITLPTWAVNKDCGTQL